jgi:hypothetical protein
MNILFSFTLLLLPLLASSKCHKKEGETADKVTDKVTDKSKASETSSQDSPAGPSASDSHHWSARCSSGYLEVCDSVKAEDCKWRPGTAKDLEKYKSDMKKGSEQLEEGKERLKRIPDKYKGLVDPNLLTDMSEKNSELKGNANCKLKA